VSYASSVMPASRSVTKDSPTNRSRRQPGSTTQDYRWPRSALSWV
jgi:hypothetical protein